MVRYHLECCSCEEPIVTLLEFDFNQITHTAEHTIEEDMDDVKKYVVCPNCGHLNTVQVTALIRVKEKTDYNSFAYKSSENKRGEFENYVDELCKKNQSAWFHKDELAGIISGWLEFKNRKEAA